MKRTSPGSSDPPRSPEPDPSQQPWNFLRKAVQAAQQAEPLGTFLGEIVRPLAETTGFDCVALNVVEHGRDALFQCTREVAGEYSVTVTFTSGRGDPGADQQRVYDRLRQAGSAADPTSDKGSAAVWLEDVKASLPNFRNAAPTNLWDYQSLVLIPFVVEPKNRGLMVCGSRERRAVDHSTMACLELSAESLGIALTVRNTQALLRERIKELSCLYKMALLVEEPGTSLEEVLEGVVELLPEAWLYPREACARIKLDNTTFQHGDFSEAGEFLTAEIVVLGRARGIVQVGYSAAAPSLSEGAFLREEKTLLDTVAREIALIVERKQREVESQQLEEQLQHADRLATIGEFSAGIAHELNEPLANILGFAQLAGKGRRLPRQTRQDISRIIDAALHARGLTQQLLLFSRRMPQNRASIDLNEVVADALCLLQPLFAGQGWPVKRLLSSGPLPISADAGQIRQVVVNLTVNAVQALQGPGQVTVSTASDSEAGTVRLVVEDTGIGMSPDLVPRIFLPFFTTKEAGQGTGLGLAVVHGIVTSHGGRIEVDSRPGVGSRFTVHLPASAGEEIEQQSDGRKRK